MSRERRLLLHLVISFIMLTARYLQVGYLMPGAGIIAGCAAYILTRLLSDLLDWRRAKESEGR